MSDEEQSLPARSTTKADIAYLMKRQGLSLSDIADELHVEPTSIDHMISARYRTLSSMMPMDEKKNILDMENDRLEYYLSKLWEQINYGDVKAIMTALAIHDRKMRANYLDKPDAANNQQTVLVIGGQESDYVEQLKQASS